jgi:hypothetical protein
MQIDSICGDVRPGLAERWNELRAVVGHLRRHLIHKDDGEVELGRHFHKLIGHILEKTSSLYHVGVEVVAEVKGDGVDDDDSDFGVLLEERWEDVGQGDLFDEIVDAEIKHI